MRIERLRTFSLKWTVEHWRRLPISLWGFQVSDFDLSIPSNLVLCFRDKRHPPPHAAYLGKWQVHQFLGSKRLEERKRSKLRVKESGRKSNYSRTNWRTVWDHSYTFHPLRRFQSQLDHLYLLAHSLPLYLLTLSSLFYSPLRQSLCHRRLEVGVERAMKRGVCHSRTFHL